MDLPSSMDLAGRNLVAMLSPDRGWLPLWSVDIDDGLRARARAFWPSHNVGRWWDAMLRLEAASGPCIPPHVEGPMRRHLDACLANPLGVCGYLEPRDGLPDGPDPAGWFDNHSQRELLLALAGLVRRRGDPDALAAGRALVAALERWIRPDGDWDIAGMAAACRAAGLGLEARLEAFYDGMRGVRHVESHGRLIEALLEFHDAAGHPPALLLARRLGEWHLRVSLGPDGRPPEAEHTHTHSWLGTLRGLLRWGEVDDRPEAVDRVMAAWDSTIRRYVRRTGFVSHDLRTERDGETGSLGDVVVLALRLSRHGRPELLDDAARLVRCRLLPSQIVTPLGLRPADDAAGDLASSLDARALGAFGGMHRDAHGGAQPTTDITAADLGALCEVYAASTVPSGDGLRIDLPVDRDDGLARIAATRGVRARLSIVPARPAPLTVRIPGWTPQSGVTVTVGGRPLRPVIAGGCLHVPRQPAGSAIVVEHGLPETTTEEVLDGVAYRVRWRGDDITGIAPNPGPRPFYPALP